MDIATNTFQHLFCEAEHCAEGDFVRRVFWRCLPVHAMPLALLLGGWESEFFRSDRALIRAAGRAFDLPHVAAEVSDFFRDADQRRWLRRRALVRVSTTRLQHAAKLLFAHARGDAADAPPRLA